MVSSPFDTSDFFGSRPSQRCTIVATPGELAAEPESPKIGSFVPQRGDAPGWSSQADPRSPDRRRVTSASWRCPMRSVSTLFGIFDVMNALRAHGPRRRRRVAGAVSRRDRGRSGGPAGAGQRRAGQRAAGDRHHRDERHRDRAVRAAAGRMAGRRAAIRVWSTGCSGCTSAAPCSARPARGSSCWPRRGCSTARTRRCTSATPGRSRPRIRPFRFIRSACS